jgi:hypothetical protein
MLLKLQAFDYRCCNQYAMFSQNQLTFLCYRKSKNLSANSQVLKRGVQQIRLINYYKDKILLVTCVCGGRRETKVGL